MNEEKISVEVDGIKVEIDPHITIDCDFLEQLYELQEYADDNECGVDPVRSSLKMGKTLLGTIQWQFVKKELRKKNGSLGIDVVMDFINNCIIAVSEKMGSEAKN